MCPPRTGRSGPETAEAPVGISGVPCGQPAAAGALCIQPRSGKNPRGAREGFAELWYRAARPQLNRSATVRVAACGAARERRKFLTTAALRPRRSRQRPVPVPEGRRRRLAGGKSARADAAPGNRATWLGAPTGHRRKWPEATRGGGNAAGRPPPKTSSMPRWGMARSVAQPGAASAGADLPPANFLRRPSGTKSQALPTILWPSPGARPAANFRGKQGFCGAVVSRLYFPGSSLCPSYLCCNSRPLSR